MKTCETCRFADLEDSMCRIHPSQMSRRPPQMSRDDADWPFIRPIDLCADHQPAPLTAAREK